MEKFSAYRDPGTGIQPFLTPVPTGDASLISRVSIPLRLALGLVRTTLVLAIALVYLVLVNGLILVLYPVPLIYRFVENSVTAILGRTILFVLGVFWIHVEQFNRKRSRGPKLPEKWNPKAGDIIVSNWSSWIDVIWLTLRFNPEFILAVPETPRLAETQVKPSTPNTHTSGRRTGSANVKLPSKSSVSRISIRGFQRVSLFKLISITGCVPPYDVASPCLALEEIQQQSTRPIVIFPECTTSNGRGLLRFASVFQKTVPVKKFQVFVLSIRHDPPSTMANTLTLSIPTRLNPLPHLFAITTSLALSQITIRLLAPSESPGSQLFIASEILAEYAGDDQLSEACAILIASMGKLKRTGMGWEDKCSFLEFYESKRFE